MLRYASYYKMKYCIVNCASRVVSRSTVEYMYMYVYLYVVFVVFCVAWF